MSMDTIVRIVVFFGALGAVQMIYLKFIFH